MIVIDQKHKEQIRDWVALQLGIDKLGGDIFTTIGFVKKEQLVGGLVLHEHNGFMIEITGASIDPTFIDRSGIRAACNYVFKQLGLVRINARVAKKNKKARNFVERLGFKQEGCARAAYDGEQDAIIYGMLRSECRWI